MIKLSKAISSRSLLLLFCFTLFIYLPGCGGSSSSGGGGEDVTYTLTITTTPAVDSFDAGEIVTITATVMDSNGLAASGQAVTFTMFRNNSGGTLTVLGTGNTDANGEAQATYTLGSNSSTEDVADTIIISIPDSSETITINRRGRTYTLTVTMTPGVTSFKAGETVTLTATVTDSSGAAASGQAVTFSMFRNNSGGTLTVLGTGTTDADGEAQATYTLGSASSTEDVVDTIDISIPSASQTITINRDGETYSLAVTTDVTTIAAGEVTTITATVTNSAGQPASGQAVTFTVAQNDSGGTITIAGTGTTDANGEIEAYFTAGSTDPTEQVQDVIDISIPTDSETVTITRSVANQAASLDLAALPTSILTDDSITSVITVRALNSGNATLTGVTVNLSTDTGILSAPSVTTPGTVELTCGSNKINRTATVTATATAAIGNITAQIPVQITGSTLTITSDATSVSTVAPGNTANLTITAKDAGGNVVSGATVNLTQAPKDGLGSGSVTFGATTGTTNASGQFKTTATGNTDGTVTITAGALGAMGTTNVSVSSPADTFRIIYLSLDGAAVIDASNISITALKINAPHSLRVIVHAPATVNNVTFATTIGVWDAGTSMAVTKAVYNHATYGRIAEATLTTTTIGLANVQVYDAANSDTNDTLSVWMASDQNPAKISLQATPTVVPISVGDTTGSSTLTAMVTDAANNPLGDQPVLFSIVEGTSTSGGETIVPVVVMTAATGQASTTFTSGSMPSTGTGVNIRASVVGAAPNPDPIETEPIGVNSTDSGNDAKIVIGGLAGSIAFGQATTVSNDETTANYLWKMSVLVSDSNGSAVEGAVVSLGVWPIAWSTGGPCTYDPDAFVCADDDGHEATDACDDEDGVIGTDGFIDPTTTCVNDDGDATTDACDDEGVPGPDGTYDATNTCVDENATSGDDCNDDAFAGDDPTNVCADENANPGADDCDDWTIADGAQDSTTTCFDDNGVGGDDCDDWDVSDGIQDSTSFGMGTFWNEDHDTSENLILDSGEDAWRCFYAYDDMCNGTVSGHEAVIGAFDALLTPHNSQGGALPPSVTTDENGVAGFTLTYPKQSAIWTLVRIRATTLVQGTETRSQIILRLVAADGDVNPCRLGVSPYTF